MLEDTHVVWTGTFVFALLWLVIVLSLGAITLLYVLIRRGAASRVASLFFLVPPTTALIAWPVFGELWGRWSCSAWRSRSAAWRWRASRHPRSVNPSFPLPAL